MRRPEDLTVSLGKTVDCIVSSEGGPDSTTIQSTTSASRTAWDRGSLRHRDDPCPGTGMSLIPASAAPQVLQREMHEKSSEFVMSGERSHIQPCPGALSPSSNLLQSTWTVPRAWQSHWLQTLCTQGCREAAALPLEPQATHGDSRALGKLQQRQAHPARLTSPPEHTAYLEQTCQTR